MIQRPAGRNRSLGPTDPGMNEGNPVREILRCTYRSLRTVPAMGISAEPVRGRRQPFADTCATWQVETDGWTEVRMRIRRFPW